MRGTYYFTTEVAERKQNLLKEVAGEKPATEQLVRHVEQADKEKSQIKGKKNNQAEKKSKSRNISCFEG